MSFRTACVAFVFALAVLVAAHSAEATEYHIKKGSSGSGAYPDLETLRNAVTLSDGDVIILHNDDNSLLGDLVVPDNARITIKSADDRCTISGAAGATMANFIAASDLNGNGDAPEIVLDNIRIADSASLNAGAVFIHAHYDEPGRLSITDSAFENNVSRLRYGPVTMAGNIDAEIANTVFRDNTVGDTPGITVTLGVGAVHAYAMGGQALALDIRDSLIENNQSTSSYGAVTISGNVSASIMNTVMRGNYADAGGAGALVITAEPGTTAEVTIGVDSSYAPCYLTWEGNTAGGDSGAIRINAAGDVVLTADVARDKVFYIKDNIDAYVHGPDGSDPAGNLEIVKTGQGTWKLGGEVNLMIAMDATASVNSIIVREGTLQLTEDFILASNADLVVEAGATFKPSVALWETGGKDADGHQQYDYAYTFLMLDTFNGEQGAKLAVGNVSSLPYMGEGFVVPDGEWHLVEYFPPIAIVADADNSHIPDSMRINNRLLVADLVLDGDTIILDITHLAPLSTLDGIGWGADAYRRLDGLTDVERDLLDNIYNNGGITRKYEKAHLQAIEGTHIALAQLAMRQHLNNLVRRISQRITSFQDEELDLCPDESSFMRDGFVGTKGEATGAFTNYGELWGYIDQTFTDQKDAGDLAGYTYRPAGIAIGYDKHTSDVIYGGVARFDMGEAKLKSNKANRTEIRTLLAAAYASWSRDGYYITGGVQAGYGWNRSETRYAIPCFSAKAESDGYRTYLFGANAEVGYLYDFGDGDYPWRIVPHAGLSYGYITREAFSETGAGHLNRHFGSDAWNMYDVSMGVRVTRPFDVNGCLVIPAFDISYVRTAGSAGDKNGNINFIEDPSRNWSIDPIDANRNALHVSAGLNARFKHNWDVGVNYDFEWRKNFLNNQFNLNVSKGF